MKQGDRVMDKWGGIYRVVWMGREALVVTFLEDWPEGEDFLRPGHPMPRVPLMAKADLRLYDAALHEELGRVREEYYRKTRRATKSHDEWWAREKERLFARMKPLPEEEE